MTCARVRLFDMVGTYYGTVSITPTAKNYCSGSTIQLQTLTRHHIVWDDNPECPQFLNDADFRCVERI